MSGRRGRELSSGLVLSIVWCAVARAEPTEPVAPRAEPSLEWRAPEGCPARGAVLAQVTELAGRDEVSWSRFSRIRGLVEPVGGGWRLELEFVGAEGMGRRTFESGRCGELAEAAAVAIVLAHRESTSDATTPTTDADAAPSRKATARVHGGRAQSVAPPRAAGSVEPGAGDALPAPGAATAPPPDDGAASDETATRLAGGAPATADGVAEAEDAAKDLATPRASSTPTQLGFALGAEALLDPNTLGSAALGGALGLELSAGRLESGVYGALLPAVTTRLGADRAIDVGLWTSGWRGCWRWGAAFDTCALLELGQVRARGVRLERASEGRDLWATPGVGVGWTATPFTGFAVTTRLSVYHPLVRGRFRVDESDVVHRIPSVGFRAAVGIALPLL